MGEGEGGEALSFFRFHLSPFPQKRLILRLCLNKSTVSTLCKAPHKLTQRFVGQQFHTLLDVTCFVRLHSLSSVTYCWDLLHPLAHTTANTEATSPNIVGPTMLGVTASVCM